MRALTLHQPWDFAMLCGKDVENRTWAPPEALVGHRFALHAGKVYDYDGLAFIKTVLDCPIETLTPGAVFATTRLVGWVEVDTVRARKIGEGALCSCPEARAALASPWFFGPVGWLIDETRRLEKPVPCRGAQGLWTLPPEVEVRVREQEASRG